MDRLASMGVFVKTAELRSFAAAAVALSISPQMVAKHIAHLEARMGTRLLNRTTRRQSLTEIGRTYLERCQLVLAEVDWAESLAAEARGVPRGKLRINAPVSFGAHSLMPVVTRYLREHTEVKIELTLSDRLVDLVEDGFEAAFRIGPLPDSSLKAIELAPFRTVACASRDYLAARGLPQTPAELVEHVCLVYSRSPSAARDEWVFIRNGMTEAVRPTGRLQVNDAKALLSAAIDGFGIVLIAEDLARDPLLSGQLVRVLPDYDTPARPMHLLFLADRRQTPKLKSFIDTAVIAFGPSDTRSRVGS